MFDAIEPFRPWADAVALDLAIDGQLDARAFEQRGDASEEGLWLSAAGKDRVIEAMLSFLETTEAHQEKRWRRRALLEQRARQLAALLLG